MVVDYSGDSVTAQNFLEVLAGREDAPTILGGNGKTIQSGAGDRVWLYYADHGAPGILGMPTGAHKHLTVDPETVCIMHTICLNLRVVSVVHLSHAKGFGHRGLLIC